METISEAVMTPEGWLEILRLTRIVAVVRSDQADQAYAMARAAIAGGLQLIEVSWLTQGAAALVGRLRQDFPQVWVGAGTLLTPEHFRTASQSGAQFYFTPHTNFQILQAARELGVPVIPGAFSPTEIMAAWEAGATSIKVFPIHSLGGPAYIRSLAQVFPQVSLIPTGGVTLENASAFVRAGAQGVGLASELFPREMVTAGAWDRVEEQSRRLVRAVYSGMEYI